MSTGDANIGLSGGLVCRPLNDLVEMPVIKNTPALSGLWLLPWPICRHTDRCLFDEYHIDTVKETKTHT